MYMFIANLMKIVTSKDYVINVPSYLKYKLYQ